MPRKKNPHSTPYIKPNYHSQQNKKHTSEQDTEKTKIKLRTSLDIYNRLIHDQTLNINLNNVFIGYSDHVLGNQEICILDWVMIDKGGDIPMHHILYFIFIQNNANKIILWDRKLKLDRLYCSGLTNKHNQSLQYVLQYQQQSLFSIQHKTNKTNKSKKQLQQKKKNNKPDEMNPFVDYNKPTIAFDIDGTLVDIEHRLSQSNRQVLSGENYQYDQVIPVALAYLKYIESTNQYNIIYISGRRYENIKHSIHWLFEMNGYPKGYVIHKQKRAQLLKYKQQQLKKLKDKLDIIAYFGDTIIDCIAAINADIRPIMIVANQWLFVKHIYGGIESVVNCMTHIKPSHIDIAKRSPFWGMSYIDLIPIQFATELFNNKDKNLLPPSVILECKQNENYLHNILAETQQILQYQQKNNDDNKEEKYEIHDQEKKIDIPKEIFVENEIMNQLFPRYPITNDGFVESFDVNDKEKWMKYLNDYGLVVLKVLTAKQANKTISAMFDELYYRTLALQKHKDRKIYKVDIHNPFTWNSFNFPSPFGKFLTDRPAFCKQAFKNRCCSKMYKIWSTIFGQNNLNITIENWGIQRGTKDLNNWIDPETNKKILNCQEQMKWRRNLRPHWDINPWSYCNNLESGNYRNLYQGALALSEQRLEDGTHLTLPGGANFLSKWCDKNKKENINPFKHNIDFNDELIKYMQAIPLRQGEMVIWNFGQLHANTKNMSNRMRLSQYIRMVPSESKYIERDRRCVQQQMIKYKDDIDINKIMGDMDDRTAKLLGLKGW